MQGSWVQFLVWKLRSHMPWVTTKNKQLKSDPESVSQASSSLDIDLWFQGQMLAAGWGAVGGGGSAEGFWGFIFSVPVLSAGASSALIALPPLWVLHRV